ncbi:hypothetical protein ECANGB1_2342 [Enterospora canceri]|uniref:Uncharacterized protein n=1 Tax=Enterospora canceri TaxID=1081671 RepID=A0A1Y1S8M0_9MICR|nr:hypothetical protein ECANGB1_2342 [Enterospora canceri]
MNKLYKRVLRNLQLERVVANGESTGENTLLNVYLENGEDAGVKKRIGELMGRRDEEKRGNTNEMSKSDEGDLEKVLQLYENTLKCKSVLEANKKEVEEIERKEFNRKNVGILGNLKNETVRQHKQGEYRNEIDQILRERTGWSKEVVRQLAERGAVCLDEISERVEERKSVLLAVYDLEMCGIVEYDRIRERVEFKEFEEGGLW